jgi:pathogenesis-related protein 1
MSAGAASAGDLTGAQANEFVAAHNAVRRNTSSSLGDLTWASDLAALAQGWSQTRASQGCSMQHNAGRGQTGENIFWASAVMWSDGTTEVQEVSPTMVTNDWSSEVQFYDYQNNSCAAGQQCGHYTQVVWSGTTEVGCGMTVCPDSSQIWVCNYRPAGNYVGQKPY